jgi:hypothetical protein
MNLKSILFFNFILLFFLSSFSAENNSNSNDKPDSGPAEKDKNELFIELETRINNLCGNTINYKQNIETLQHNYEDLLQKLIAYQDTINNKINTLTNKIDTLEQEQKNNKLDPKTNKDLSKYLIDNFKFYNNREYYFITFSICILTIALYNTIYSLKERYKKYKNKNNKNLKFKKH